MSGALYQSVLRASAKTLASYAVGMVVYLWLIIGIFPTFAHSRALATLLKGLPPGMLRVLGYHVGATHLAGFLAGEFYGLIYLVIMSMYALFTASQLMAHWVDNGSMAYLLASPVSRRRVAATQALVLFTGVVVIGGATVAGGILGVHWLAPNVPLATGPFIAMNLVGTLMFCVVGAYAFGLSAAARDERTALGLSTMLTLVFYGLDLVGELTPSVHWLTHVSLFSVFNASQLIHGQGPIAADVVGLSAATGLLVIGGIAAFQRRQLSL